MARLITSGAELGAFDGLTGVDGSSGISFNTIPTFDTAIKRSGARSFKCDGTQAGSAVAWTFTGALNRWYFSRAYFYFDDVIPDVDTTLITFYNGLNGVQNGALMIGTDSKIYIASASSSRVGVASDPVTTGVWHRLDLAINASGVTGTSQARARLNGVDWQGLVTGMDMSTVTPASVYLGTQSSTGAGCGLGSPQCDDFAVNDDQGASENSWPPEGRVVILKPISDNARVGFTAGAAATTNLWDAEDNVPPAGVVLASATNTSQIKDATNNATDHYDPNCQTYTTGGAGAGDGITVAQAFVAHGNSSVTSRNGGISATSNPVIAEATGGTGTTAAATYPTGWTTLKTAYSYSPAVTKGSSPVLKFRKGTASTDSSMACSMGLLVEYSTKSLPYDGGRRLVRNNLLRR